MASRIACLGNIVRVLFKSRRPRKNIDSTAFRFSVFAWKCLATSVAFAASPASQVAMVASVVNSSRFSSRSVERERAY